LKNPPHPVIIVEAPDLLAVLKDVKEIREVSMEQGHFSLNTALSVFRALFEDIENPAMNLLRKDYSVLWANRGMAAAVQRPVSEMIGRPCYQAFRRREEPCEVCLLRIVSATKQPYVAERTLDLPRNERQYGEVRAYPILDGDGLVQFLFEIITNLTGKKKDEGHRRRYVESLERTLREVTTAGTETIQQGQTLGKEVILTLRETEVLRLVAKGFSNREIGSILSIRPDTVKTHVRNIFYKLDVTDRTEAAVWASLNSLI
jgi:DNA-binding CsgD family transcriptional regulator